MSQRRYTFISLIIIASLLIGCAHHSSSWHDMDLAESLMEALPDSALTVLESIDRSGLSSSEEEESPLRVADVYGP